MSDIHSRHAALIDPSLSQGSFVIAGAGMIGGWTALALARAVGKLYIFDHDKIEDVNVGCQPYSLDNVSAPKASTIESFCSGLPVTSLNMKFPPRSNAWADGIAGVVCAVDSMAGRRVVAERCHKLSVPFFLDGRILGEIAVLAVVQHEHKGTDYEAYLANLPSDKDVPNATCGASGTAYAGMFLAGRITADLNNLMRGQRLPALRVWHVGQGQVINSFDTFPPKVEVSGSTNGGDNSNSPQVDPATSVLVGTYR